MYPCYIAYVPDPLNFKPNLANFGVNGDAASDDSDDDAAPKASTSGVYRPPRLAPLPYNEEARGKCLGMSKVVPVKYYCRSQANDILWIGKKVRERPVGNALVRDMAASLTNATANPYAESTSGLGVTPTMQSRKAAKLADIERYEEENYTRLFMNKKDAKRRRMDEEDLALGGTGSREDLMAGSKGVRGQRSHGFENEFDDLLGSIGRKRKTGAADGYVCRHLSREMWKAGPGTDMLHCFCSSSSGTIRFVLCVVRSVLWLTQETMSSLIQMVFNPERASEGNEANSRMLFADRHKVETGQRRSEEVGCHLRELVLLYY